MADPVSRSSSGSSGLSPLQMYLAVVVGLGGIVLAASGVEALRAPQPLGWLTLGALAMIAGSFRLNFVAASANISIADTFFITIAILFGPGPAALAIAAGGFVTSAKRRAPWRQVAFNTAAPSISLWVAAQVFLLLAGIKPLAYGDVRLEHVIFPLLWTTGLYFLLNSGLVATAVGLDS